MTNTADIGLGAWVVPVGASRTTYAGKVVRDHGDGHVDVCWRETRMSTQKRVKVAKLESRPARRIA